MAALLAPVEFPQASRRYILRLITRLLPVSLGRPTLPPPLAAVDAGTLGFCTGSEDVTSSVDGSVSSLQPLAGAGELSLTLSEEQRLALRFTERLRVFAARRLNDPAAGEDVAQETLRLVVEAMRANRIGDPNALPGFVFQTARNVCMHWVRSTAREKSAFARLANEPVAAAESTDALTSLITAERAHTVKRAINRLSRENQLLLIMMYYDGLDTDEIAKRLGLSAAAVRVRKHRALQRLSAELTNSGWK